MVVNLDPHAPRTTTAHLNLPALGLDWEDTFAVHDEITGEDWQWGAHNFVHLDPYVEPAHVLTVGTACMSEMMPAGRRTRRGPIIGGFEQPDWFKTAVFYEVLVRSFKDSNGDGVGDFRGLTEKLDYLHWLGVDCLWVPPFFSSPLRDGGYDVADYTNILPEAGTVEDFHHFLDEAHKRDMRVIIDFVMNHTSDQHPWFQASREDPDGPYGDFYVWSDTDDLYEEARVIFVDTEPSNWTWDPVRQQYFWHRFFSHQPDLNFDNPKVMEAMLDAMSFWLDMGLDGFRLDAVPYLYERPGTNGENLPETHEALRRVRSYVDEQLPGPGAARRGQPVAGRRGRLLRRQARPRHRRVPLRRRRVPHVLPLPRDATHLHGRTPGEPVPDLGDPRADPGDPGRLPVGHLPAQPRRADPRDGHRRGPRLHVGRVRQGPTDEGQHRHPPAARPAAGQRRQPDGAVHGAAALAARLAGALLRRRDRDGRQHLAR